MIRNNLHEKLAEIEHDRWSSWQNYVHSVCKKNEDGTLTIPKWAVDGWTRQINTSYNNLTESEKESDREQVDRYWNLISDSY